ARRAAVLAFRELARIVGHIPARALRAGSDDEPRTFVEQLCATLLERAWRSREDGVDYFARLPAIQTPTLSLVGAGDRLCRPPDARALLDPLGAAHKQLRVVGRGNGLPFDPTHFSIVTDARARPAWDEITT